MQLICDYLGVFCGACQQKTWFKDVNIRTCTDVLSCKHCSAELTLPGIAVGESGAVLRARLLEIGTFPEETADYPVS